MTIINNKLRHLHACMLVSGYMPDMGTRWAKRKCFAAEACRTYMQLLLVATECPLSRIIIISPGALTKTIEYQTAVTRLYYALV